MGSTEHNDDTSLAKTALVLSALMSAKHHNIKLLDHASKQALWSSIGTQPTTGAISLTPWILHTSCGYNKCVDGSSTSNSPQNLRSISTSASSSSVWKSFTDLFNWPSLMHPDIYNSQEKQAADTYRFSNKHIGDPFNKKQPLDSWNLYANDNEGWSELERRSRYFWNRFTMHRVCRQSLWGFSSKALKERAIYLYHEINSAVAEGHKGKAALDGIKELVVPTLFDQMQGDAVRLQQSGRIVKWKMVRPPTPADIKLVNGGFAKAVNSQQLQVKLHFAQWTLEIQSEQSFAVYETVPRGGGTRLIAGDLDKPLKVVDYWVLERPIFKSWFVPKPGPRHAEWRLAARLKIPERPPQLGGNPQH